MASRDTNRCVYQFVAKDRGDLHWQQIFRLAQVRPDENLKVAILAALIIPTFADPLAAPAAGCEANRDAQARG